MIIGTDEIDLTIQAASAAADVYPDDESLRNSVALLIGIVRTFREQPTTTE